eukprot:6228022-Prorocentrum_lima.AAC.1
MTSSLVGSEMCIRDRRIWSQPAFGELVAVTKPGPKRALESRGQVGYYAVSYTHLTLPTICSV